MKEKTSKLLRYRDMESDLPLMADILGVSDDCLLLDGGMTWYAVDFDGEMIENTEFSVNNGISLFDGYVVERVSNELYYRGYSDVERKKICDVGDCLAYECDLVERDGKSGFVIRKSYGKGKAEEIWRFSFYDFATEEFYEITEQRPESFLWTRENEYFMTYDREATEITVHSGCLGFGKKRISVIPIKISRCILLIIAVRKCRSKRNTFLTRTRIFCFAIPLRTNVFIRLPTGVFI
jgi:hypothetical protein